MKNGLKIEPAGEEEDSEESEENTEEKIQIMDTLEEREFDDEEMEEPQRLNVNSVPKMTSLSNNLESSFNESKNEKKNSKNKNIEKNQTEFINSSRKSSP